MEEMTNASTAQSFCSYKLYSENGHMRKATYVKYTSSLQNYNTKNALSIANLQSVNKAEDQADFTGETVIIKITCKNGHIRKNLTQSGEPQRYSWGTQKKKKKKKKSHASALTPAPYTNLE